MMHHSVGIRSLALSLPSIRRTNDYYLEKYPELVERAEQKSLARMFSLAGSTPSNEFEIEMMPYLSDPFRGTVERWVLGPDESSLTLEYRAARDALDAANLSPNDVDLMIVSSVLPAQIGLGNAAFLARQLDLKGAAWNLDGACGSTPVALQTACALVQAGEYCNVLVVVSCTYSRLNDEDDTVSWFLGDGAGAIVVSLLESNQGILGTKTIHTGSMCDLVSGKIALDAQGNPQIRMKIGKHAAKLMREEPLALLRKCCEGAVAAAGVTLEQVDFFLFNTPSAWFWRSCTRALGIDPEHTLNLYPQYANIGPVLTVANMYHATQLGKIRENDLVLVYGFGAAGVAAANVMRWGKVALGPAPKSETDFVEGSSKAFVKASER